MIFRAVALLLFGPLCFPPQAAQAQGSPTSSLESERDRGLALLHARALDEALACFESYERACVCAEAAFLRGRVLLELERPQSAADAFLKSLELEGDKASARLHLARAWERLGLFARADSLLRTVPMESRNASRDENFHAGTLAAGGGKALGQADSSMNLRALPGRVNSPADDYLPWQSIDGQQLVFTSNRPGGLDEEGRAGLHREDLWQSRRLVDGAWESARLVEELNTAASEGGMSQSADGRTVIFGACDRPGSTTGCDLLLSRGLGAGWSPPDVLPMVNSSWWDSQPALSADGRLLVFASNRPGGLGGRDLWMSRRDSLGSFGPAENMGAPVNSAGDEAGPFLHADGRSLYFSSDGHGGLGSLDIFLSRLGANGAWSVPVNLGPPFCTAGPDLGLSLDGSGRRAIFASRRDGPDLDLYEATLPACCPAEERRLLAGRVRERGSGRPLPARVRLEPLHGSEPEWSSQEADSLGRFVLVAPAGEGLLFADHPGHLYACRLVDAQQAGDSLLLELAPLTPGTGVVLESLHFAFNDAILSTYAPRVLEPLRRLLLSHADLAVELRGHTDDVGSARHNEELSLRRAQAVEAWLLHAGVRKIQVSSSGAGDTEPVDPGRDAAARAANRRTELWLRQR